jgi:hypothetical protein
MRLQSVGEHQISLHYNWLINFEAENLLLQKPQNINLDMLKTKLHILVQETINFVGRKEDIYEMNGRKNNDKEQHGFINLRQINKRVSFFLIAVPCILIIVKFLSPTNPHFIKHIKC